MTTHFALVVGLKKSSSLALRLKGHLTARALTPLFVDDWSMWRVTLLPCTGEYEVRSSDGRTRANTGQIRVVLFFGNPIAPVVDSSDQVYQALEFEALLLGLCVLIDSRSAERWRYIAAGVSDTAYRISDEFELGGIGSILSSLFRLDAAEAFFYRRNVRYRTPDGIVHSVANPPSVLKGVSLPVSVALDRGTHTFVPFVGVIPQWLIEESVYSEVVDDLLQKPTGRDVPVVHRRAALSTQDRRLTVLAHRRDSVAAHLVHRARRRRLETNVLDLTVLYSDECNETAFEESLATLESAAFVFARPLLVFRGMNAESMAVAAYRHGRFLRALQSRSNTTVNPPDAGHTNIAKAAHAAFMARQGIRVPATLSTNDARAVESFVDEHAQVIFKSGCSVRSLTALYKPSDASRLDAVYNCPVLFQQFIDGADYRLHLALSKHSALRIDSELIDYRAAATTRAEVFDIPEELTRLIAEAVDTAGLNLCGCDLRWDSTLNRWYVLEMNRNPAFSYYDHLSPTSVADHILDAV